MSSRKLLSIVVFELALVAVSGAGGAFAYRWWKERQPAEAASAETKKPEVDGSMPVRIGREARLNMGLVSQPLQKTTYWRSIDVPGVVTDRPGVSDRRVVAPVTGIVTQIHAYPGDTVAPEAALFSLRLVSESLHASQLELFKATKEIELAQQEKKRLEGVAASGGLRASRIIEFDQQIQRMEVNLQAYRQDLLSRGLPNERIDSAARGEFITEIVVRAPTEEAMSIAEIALVSADDGPPRGLPFSFELQSLAVEVGQQVEAGSLLCSLADHRALVIEGRGFKKDMSLVQAAAKDGLPVAVSFEEDTGRDWPTSPGPYRIERVGNQIDVDSRTFAFQLPLENQWQVYAQHGRERMLWRYRPGDRARLSVAVEKLDDVYVVPQAAVAREGPEAFVFRQNGDLFDRIPVHVLHEDASQVAIAASEKLRKGAYIAQNSAAALHRVLKAQLASGQPTNLHVHADGTVHEAH
jgi:cobalt-zinc-cadmium efflux system membrane fusion protein